MNIICALPICLFLLSQLVWSGKSKLESLQEILETPGSRLLVRFEFSPVNILKTNEYTVREKQRGQVGKFVPFGHPVLPPGQFVLMVDQTGQLILQQLISDSNHLEQDYVETCVPTKNYHLLQSRCLIFSDALTTHLGTKENGNIIINQLQKRIKNDLLKPKNSNDTMSALHDATPLNRPRKSPVLSKNLPVASVSRESHSVPTKTESTSQPLEIVPPYAPETKNSSQTSQYSPYSSSVNSNQNVGATPNSVYPSSPPPPSNTNANTFLTQAHTDGNNYRRRLQQTCDKIQRKKKEMDPMISVAKKRVEERHLIKTFLYFALHFLIDALRSRVKALVMLGLAFKMLRYRDTNYISVRRIKKIDAELDIVVNCLKGRGYPSNEKSQPNQALQLQSGLPEKQESSQILSTPEKHLTEHSLPTASVNAVTYKMTQKPIDPKTLESPPNYEDLGKSLKVSSPPLSQSQPQLQTPQTQQSPQISQSFQSKKNYDPTDINSPKYNPLAEDKPNATQTDTAHPSSPLNLIQSLSQFKQAKTPELLPQSETMLVKNVETNQTSMVKVKAFDCAHPKQKSFLGYLLIGKLNIDNLVLVSMLDFDSYVTSKIQIAVDQSSESKNDLILMSTTHMISFNHLDVQTKEIYLEIEGVIRPGMPLAKTFG